MKRVLVVDREGTFTQRLATAAASMQLEFLRLRRSTRVAEAVRTAEADVLVAGPHDVSATGLRRLAAVHREHPNLVVVLAQNGTPVPAQGAVACGAREVLPWPATPARLRRGLERALGAIAAPVAPALQKTASMYTVTSATGGCGKTFYATNLAAYLARATGGRVLLVDLDLQFGEVSIALRVKSDRTIAELIDEGTHALAEYTTAHDAGYDVLCAPKDPISAERVGPRETTAVLEAARTAYDHIVVDTPPALNEIVLAAFDMSGTLVVMATMDVPSLRNLTVFLQTLERLKVPASGVSLVLNKAEHGTGIDLAQVCKLHDFSAVLPYARDVSRSINLGMPVVLSSPQSEVSRKLVAGAMRLVPPTTDFALPPAPVGWRFWKRGERR